LGNKKSFQIKERRENNRDIFDYNSILVCGKEYKVKDYPGKKPGLSNDYFLIPSKYSKDKYVNVIKKWLKSLSSEMIEKRLNELSSATNLQYKSVKIGNFKAKWGSCDSSKNIKINYKVVMLPHKIIDAVLLHELVHTKIMNHSQAFYTKLISIMPEYKKYRAVLKNYGFLLKLY
jgi:predicted metal-dependent hydrolase